LLLVDCDILAPCALEQVITTDNASQIKAKMIVEGANGPITPSADAILEDMGVLVLPDVLANAGGVTVSYYEWVQNRRSEQWTVQEVDERLETAMHDAYDRMYQFAKLHNADYRRACYGVALQRIAQVYAEREIFP
jgi:glutamate dehydrogenase/leucine dehydrogenase